MTFQYNTCAVCGSPMSESLVRLGSIRCHDCREIAAPLLSRSVKAHSAGTLVAHTEREDSLTATKTQTDTARELAHRAGDGLDVTLVWYPDSDRIAVRVSDARTGDSFEAEAPRESALEAFEHPFAYLPDTDAPPPGRTPALTR